MNKDKRKTRMSLTSFVMAFMFISSWVVLGVALALTSANVNLGGSISFTATDIYADVTGTVTGTATTNTLTDIHFSASTKSFETPTSWSNMTLDFQKDTDIVVTVNVKNNSPERSIYIGFTDNITATNTDITRKSAGTTVTAFDTLEVPKSETKTIEITLHVTDQNKAVTGKFDLGLNLSDDEPEVVKDESEYSTLSFGCNDTKKTASVWIEENASGDIVLPRKVKHNGSVYEVCEIQLSNWDITYNITSLFIPKEIKHISNGVGMCVNPSTTKVIFEDTTSSWKLPYPDGSGTLTITGAELKDPTNAAKQLRQLIDLEWTKQEA